MTAIVEEWKNIENAINYEISNHGNVRNKITMNILKTSVMGGYLALSLHINNKKVILKIHRLVAICFLVCPDETYIVNHKDGNKTNNNVENLEWVSRSENAKHAFRLGLNKGKKIKVSKYTLDDVFVGEYDSPADAENQTGIFQTHISGVCKNCTGYMGLGLSNDKKRTNFNVHRLVALLFIDNPHDHPQVNHIDFDKTNNKVENLEWISHSDNIKHNYSKK
jgi:hypothetical protein